MAKQSPDSQPVETYTGAGATVYLYSWGSEDDPRYSVSLVPHGRSGMTWHGRTFAELRQDAPQFYPRPALDDLAAMLWKATKQLSLPIALPEMPTPPRPGRKARKGAS